jgi:hypothetical protein
MGQVLRSSCSETGHTVQIVVHVGILSLHCHLMRVRCNQDRYFSRDVLDNARSQNLQARLIGPV